MNWTAATRCVMHMVLYGALCAGHIMHGNETQPHVFSSSYFAYRAEHTAEQRPWTILVYMAADNDLFPFAIRNIEQMKQVGSNENVHIVVHFDFHQKGQEKKTKRLYIEKNQAVQIGPERCMDSGDPETLIDAGCWAIDHYPSEKLCIILWNHGSGALNPFVRKSFDPSCLFFYNTETQKVELDRSIPFSDFVHAATGEFPQRGVCFDETTGNYLNDQKLTYAFETIHAHRGQPVDLVLFDACLMACTETAWLMHKHANYMGGSQEVVLGPGYNYFLTLRKLREQPMTPPQLLCHVISMYNQTYSKITNDYTHSGYDLTLFRKLHSSLDSLARHLQDGLEYEEQGHLKRILRNSSAPRQCTHFDEPTYIDLDHFLNNLYHELHACTLHEHGRAYQESIMQDIRTCRAHIADMIIKNTAGPHFRSANGISIYYPQTLLHGSYAKTEFARNNAWGQFLRSYVM